MKKLFNNKIFKIILKTFETIIITLMIIYLGFIIIQNLNGNKSIFGYRLFTVATGSMAGTYDINDVIAVKDFDYNKLEVGDDIAYYGERGGFEGKIVTHRIMNIELDSNGEKRFYTKGVKSKVMDPSIKGKQILGKVVGVVPVISQINHAVKSQVGFFFLIFCPIVIVISLEVLQTITEIKIEKAEITKIKHDKPNESTTFKESDSNENQIDNNIDDEII